ncbi:MAG: glycosyl hydrolase [Saprospiraceae bacterium]
MKSPVWIELMQHTAKEALRLGLEFDFHNCMGWSSSGGSWITPELSMQQVVWTEAFVEGGKTVNIQLKQPFKRLDYYRDSIVLAFPSILGENGPEQNQAKKISLNGNTIDARSITGFDLTSGINVASNIPSKPSTLLFEFDQSVEFGSITLNASNIKKLK